METLCRPAKSNAVLLDFQDNITVGDCVRVVAVEVTVEAVTFSSRIRGGDICIYLRNTEHVNLLVSKEFLIIKGVTVRVRRNESEA